MTKFKLFAMTAILSTMIIDAVPCGTGGTPKAPTPDVKTDKGDSKAPATPRPSK